MASILSRSGWPTDRWRAPVRVLWLGIAAIAGTGVLAEVLFLVQHAADARHAFASDFYLYRGAAESWLATGQFYPNWQLKAPYGFSMANTGMILYPPSALIVLAPAALLPDVVDLVVWYLPLAIVAVSFLRWRPRLWAYSLTLVALAYPWSPVAILNGTPTIWIVGFIALGLWFSWPAVLVLIKPTLGPFALIGVRHRSWWIALAAVATVSVALLPLWFDYLEVIRNGHGSPGVLYSLPNVPLCLIPVVGWLARTRCLPTPRTSERP